MKNAIIRAVEQLDKGAKYYVRYLGMLRLMEAIFSGIHIGNAKSWEDNIFSALDTLTSREAKLLRLRLGLDDGNFRTLGEVADMFSVTRERIRQVEAKAFRKLKHPTRRLVLLGWNWQNAYSEVERINKLQTAKTKEAKKIEETTSKNAVSVDSLDLPTRVINSLEKAGYETVEQIKKLSDNELLQIQGLGQKSIFDIKVALHK